MMQIHFDPKKGIWAEDDETYEKLRKNYFGTKEKGGRIRLEVEEALYLITFQNASCWLRKKQIGFNELASYFAKKDKRLFIKYNAYRDWRDRGLVVKPIDLVEIKKKRKIRGKRYPAENLKTKKLRVKIYWILYFQFWRMRAWARSFSMITGSDSLESTNRREVLF